MADGASTYQDQTDRLRGLAASAVSAAACAIAAAVLGITIAGTAGLAIAVVCTLPIVALSIGAGLVLQMRRCSCVDR